MLNLDLLLRKLGWGEKKFDETFFLKKKKKKTWQPTHFLNTLSMEP